MGIENVKEIFVVHHRRVVRIISQKGIVEDVAKGREESSHVSVEMNAVFLHATG
jgi:hypothetical protein